MIPSDNNQVLPTVFSGPRPRIWKLPFPCLAHSFTTDCYALKFALEVSWLCSYYCSRCQECWALWTWQAHLKKTSHIIWGCLSAFLGASLFYFFTCVLQNSPWESFKGKRNTSGQNIKSENHFSQEWAINCCHASMRMGAQNEGGNFSKEKKWVELVDKWR